MNSASSGLINENMKYYQSGYFDLGGQTLYVSRSGFTNELGFEIYCDGKQTDHLQLWDHLMETGAPYGLEFSSTRAMTIRRIEGGILGNTTDMDTTMTPFEAGLGNFVDMEKGNFIGRSALFQADKRTILLGLTCSTATPTSGSQILDGETQVGHITAGVPSPTLGLGIGYARFFKPGEWPGRTLVLKLPDGSQHSCTIVETPFFDKDYHIVRGINRSIP